METVKQNIPTAFDITSAHQRIKPYINRTPLLSSDVLNEMAGCHMQFKCENLQKIGAFKMRGAMNAALRLSDLQRSKGLATHSSGNHAQALARAASLLGTPAYIVMPRTAPDVKKQGVRNFGGEIYECEPTLEAREAGTTEGTIVTINKAANALQQQWSVVAAQDGLFGNIFASSRRISSGIAEGGS